MNGRIYDVKLRMMLSPDVNLLDPTDGQHFNRYAYALNNPLKYSDPTGNSPCSCGQTGVGYVLSQISGAVGSLFSGVGSGLGSILSSIGASSRATRFITNA